MLLNHKDMFFIYVNLLLYLFIYLISLEKDFENDYDYNKSPVNQKLFKNSKRKASE